MLLMFIASIAAGAFSSLWLGYELNQSLLTGIHLPPFLSLGRDFVIGFFSSCIAIGTYIVFIISTIFYTKSTKIDEEDEAKEKHTRKRKRSE